MQTYFITSNGSTTIDDVPADAISSSATSKPANTSNGTQPAADLNLTESVENKSGKSDENLGKESNDGMDIKSAAIIERANSEPINRNSRACSII